MSKLKERIDKIFTNFKKSFEKFPVTMITIFLLTIIFVVDLDGDILGQELLSNIIGFGTLFGFGAFFSESIFKGKSKKSVCFVFVAIISFFLSNSNFIDLLNESVSTFIENLRAFYLITTTIFALYFNYKKSNKSFEKYMLLVFSNICKTFLIYGILAIGIAIVSVIFIYLILDDSSYFLLARIEILIVGFYLVPTLVSSLYNVEENVSKFLKVVIKYILGMLVISAFAIIYLYILKIIILRDMPSNQVFRILSSLFVFGGIIWTMIENFNEGKFIDKINSKLPILFIPFIFLQMFAIGIRVVNNGITENRYLCIMLIVFEIIYIIVYLKKKEKLGEMLVIFVMFAFVALVVPSLNMYDISRASQYNNLCIYVDKNNYTEEEQQKIFGAYKYLKRSTEGSFLIDKILTKEEQQKLSEEIDEKTNYYEGIKNKYIYANSDLTYIDVEGYSSLYKFGNYEYSKGNSIQSEFENISLNYNDNKAKLTVNLADKINEYIDLGDNLNKEFDKVNMIKVDENTEIIIKNISLSYDSIKENVEHYNISGYILIKDK